MQEEAPGPAPPKTPVSASDVERRAVEIGRELLSRAREYKPGLFTARFWSDQLMNWAMKDPAFKTQLFRFIDVFPLLNTPEMVHDYLLDYLSQPNVTLPPAVELGLKAGGLAKGLFAKTVAGRITAMAGNFIAGVDANDALPTLEKLWKQGVGFSVDLLGEACLSHSEARAYRDRYLDLVQGLPGAVAKWPANPQLETDHIGPVPRTNVSIKISSLSARAGRHRFQWVALRVKRGIETDPGSGGAERGVCELRHGTICAQGPYTIVVRAMLRSRRFSRRVGPAIVPAQRCGGRQADDRLVAAHWAANHRPPD